MTMRMFPAIAKYYLYSFFKRSSGINSKTRNLKFIVSLTTYPPRLNTVFLAIESLLNQDLKPDKIILWLSTMEISPSDLPRSLLRLQVRGLEIRWVDENVKSYKKLIYSIVEFSDYHIVTADDDFMYHRWFLRGLYESYQKYPNCISAYRCLLMSRTADKQFSPYNTWQFVTYQTPSYDIFPTSGGGVWYPMGTLNQKITDKLFMQLSPSSDDIWFKAMSLLNQTKSVMAKSHVVEFPLITLNNSQKERLWQQNKTNNDKQLKAVFDYFKLYN